MLKRLFLPFIKRQEKVTEAPAVPSGVPNPGVRIVDGKIIANYACQTEIVNHCNLSCRDCNHISPLAKKSFADPEIIYRDFTVLAKVYKPLLVYLTGIKKPLYGERHETFFI
ncbi:hypothetical protein [Methylomagnum sp.]